MMQNTEGSAIIRMFHVHKRFGKKNALTDITLDVERNDLLLVSGPSGAGKSTLLRLLYLGEALSEGQILIDGMNLSRIADSRIPLVRRQFGIIFQDYKLIQTKTVYENIALVLEVKGEKTRFIQKKVTSVLRTVGMEERINSFPPSLSGGEQQRIAVARAVVGDPKIILADEPTGSLDSESAKIIMDLLLGVHARGATVIIATHDKEIIRDTKGKVIYLKDGLMMEPPMIEPLIEKKKTITL